MKKRKGWVSNSSSTSFCLLGVTKSHLDLSLGEEEEDSYDLCDLENDILEVCSGIDEFYDDVCIGLSVGSLKDDETLLQAKQRVVDAFKKKGINISTADVDWMVDGGHDG